MSTIFDENTSSIVVVLGETRIAINLKETKTDQSRSIAYPSVIIDMNNLEIEVRRSSIIVKPPARSKSVTHRKNKKNNTSSSYWDYSTLYGNTYCQLTPSAYENSLQNILDLLGPDRWARIFPQLQHKKFQSPIRIFTNQSEYESVLVERPLVFNSDENCCQTLENTGRSFLVSGDGYSYITGGPVFDEYQFLQFHMHWGSNDNEGSEHIIDGIRLPAELHIVTWNINRYKTPEEAMASEQFDGLMVFAILINISPTDNEEIDKLLELFSKIIHKGAKINLDKNIVSLRKLMPENMQNYYTYEGSLTTPMCYESVRWIIFQDRMSLSHRQLKQLRQLKHTCPGERSTHGHIKKNFRPPTPLNGRAVYRSFH